jgi:hypothetical protein
MSADSGPALLALHASFAGPVTYRQRGEEAIATTAIRFQGDAGGAFGSTGAQRSRGYEFRYDGSAQALPFWPCNGDAIVDGDKAWRVIEVIDWPEARAVRVMVEASV